jgi:beta-aspartyl-peptidase (threonine type)
MGESMFAIAVHGGAGTLSRRDTSAEQEQAYRAGLSEALDAGYALLERGASGLDAAIAAVCVLEDNPLFNAGRGALLTRDGAAELDASVMDGRTLKAGAVTGLKHVKNPIVLARRVMDHSPHVMLVGAGAEEFARLQGVELVSNEYFRTQVRQAQLHRLLDGSAEKENDLVAFGTVGAVALDADGNVAAATSTGGMTGKRWGRVGDSPIIGAGLYVDNDAGAAGATGRGEAVITVGGSRIVVENMRRGMTPAESIRDVLERIVKATVDPRLRDSQGRPDFDVTLYALDKSGRFASGSLWSGKKFAVHDGSVNTARDCFHLFERA